MLRYIENLQLVSVIRGVTNPNAVHTNYPHRLILRLTGTIRYHAAGETVVLGPGDVLFLPNSPPYFVDLLSADTGTYIMANFSGNLPDTPAKAHALYGHPELHHLFTQMYRSWAVQTPGNRCRCMALLYELLSYFTDAAGKDSTPSAADIAPALEYLELHIFDPALRIGELHTHCGISDTYFRRIFLSRFGVSPKRYVTDRRLSQAKAILDNGEFSAIGEVALMTGFEDPLYFSKAFKNKYGYPPSNL